MKEQTEIERKFLLKQYPDILNIDGYFSENNEIINSTIDQYYLPDGSRIRKATIQDPINGTYRNLRVEFTHTNKEGKGKKRKEKIKHIQLDEFSKLKQTAVSEVRKYREEIVFDTHSFVFDTFKNIELNLMEIEVIPEKHGDIDINSIEVPEVIVPDVIMEVSNLKEFKNKNLAVKL